MTAWTSEFSSILRKASKLFSVSSNEDRGREMNDDESKLIDDVLDLKVLMNRERSKNKRIAGAFFYC